MDNDVIICVMLPGDSDFPSVLLQWCSVCIDL